MWNFTAMKPHFLRFLPLAALLAGCQSADDEKALSVRPTAPVDTPRVQSEAPDRATQSTVPADAPGVQSEYPDRRARPGIQSRMPCLVNANSGNWSLEGTLITPDAVIPRGAIKIADRRIVAIKAIRGGESPPCTTKIDGIILPGLIDLHNHLTWNVHPRWQPPNPYSNREEWQLSKEYIKILDEPQFDLVWTAELGCEANLYAEVKALVGGATSAVGSLNILKGNYPNKSRCITGLIRNLDFDSQFPATLRLPQPAGRRWRTPINRCARHGPDGNPIVDVAVNEIFPLQLSTKRACYLTYHLKTGRLRSLLVHLAEGKPTDKQSRQEFDDLKELGLVREGLIIVHGTALQHEDFVEMRSGSAGLVWSPRSNMELYGTTSDIRAALDEGVKIAIAPDWSVTGSDGMLQELKYAHANFEYFNAQQLTTMATSIPARLARIDDRIGQLKAGLYADLLVIRRGEGSAYELSGFSFTG